MKTTEQIKARIAAIANSDWLGTQTNDLLPHLSFEDARP